jgi:hypothetical protein
MKLLVPSLLLATTLCQAQSTSVPKPPWAGNSKAPAAAPTQSPEITDDDNPIKV